MASFGQSAPWKHTVFMHWQSCVLVDVLSAFGWRLHFALCIYWNAHLNV